MIAEDYKNANLCYADLSGADLSDADIRYANLYGAIGFGGYDNGR